MSAAEICACGILIIFTGDQQSSFVNIFSTELLRFLSSDTSKSSAENHCGSFLLRYFMSSAEICAVLACGILIIFSRGDQQSSAVNIFSAESLWFLSSDMSDIFSRLFLTLAVRLDML